MTLQEALDMDAVAFQKACKAAENSLDVLEPINAGNKTFDASVRRFDVFKSTPKSILAIHRAGQVCP